MIKISIINYDGAIPYTEADEFIEIANDGEVAVDVSSWVINAGPASATSKQTFTFPAHSVLQPGARRRIYTNMDPNLDGSSFRSKTPIWGNKGGTGTLYDAQGQSVHGYSYPQTAPDAWVTSTVEPGGAGTHDFGTQILGAGRRSVVFTLQNRRPDAKLVLEGSPPVSVSQGAPAFVVEEQPSSPVGAAEDAQFKVSFGADALGHLSGELSIAIEGLDSPLRVPLAGAIATKAKLELLHGADDLSSGGQLALGKLVVGASAPTTFTLANTGGSALKLSALSLSNAADFVLGSSPTMPKLLGPGERVDFQVSFAPKSAGAKHSELVVSSDAAADIELSLSGEALASEPNIAVRSGAAVVAQDGSVDLGSATVGGNAVARPFTIANSGTAPLKIEGVAVGGAGDGAYSISPAPLSQVLEPGESLDFTLHFAPKGGGVPPTKVVIRSDDPDQGSYAFTVSGKAVVPKPVPDWRDEMNGAMLGLWTDNMFKFTISGDARSGYLTVTLAGYGSSPGAVRRATVIGPKTIRLDGRTGVQKRPALIDWGRYGWTKLR